MGSEGLVQRKNVIKVLYGVIPVPFPFHRFPFLL